MLNDERYWNIKLLNKWFAISSILFLLTFIWMFIDDNDDEFKKYQKSFRKLEIENAKKKLQLEIDKVKDGRVLFDAKLNKAKNDFELKKETLNQYFLDLDSAKAKFYKANMNYLNLKSIVDAKKYDYETQKLHHHDNKPLKIEEIYLQLVADLEELKLIKEKKEFFVTRIEQKINNILWI